MKPGLSRSEGDSGYDPRSFWEERLRSHLDLAGTGEPGLSLAYNRACYRMRERVLSREIAREGIALDGARVLDVGSGVGFFVDYYLRHGAEVTGVELTEVASRHLRERFPEARFLHGDISELDPGSGYDVVNAFDVLYHIVDDERWESALRRLARALAPSATLLLTDAFVPFEKRVASHNVMRDWKRYRAVLAAEGVSARRAVPTHYLLNRDLGFLRPVNRLPGLLYAIDRTLLALSAPSPEPVNRLLIGRRDGGRPAP